MLCLLCNSLTKRTLICKRATLICLVAKKTSSVFQKRNKNDVVHDSEEAEHVTQTVLAKFANAPTNSSARVIFDTLVASGRIKIMSQTDLKDPDFAGQVLDSQILPNVDVMKQQSLKMMPPEDLFPNACSDWKITQASQLAILDDRKYTFIPNLQVPPNTEGYIERFALHALRLKDKRFDELNCETPNEWTKKAETILNQKKADYVDDDLFRFFNYFNASLIEANCEKRAARFVNSLLQLTGLDSGLLQARDKHPVKVMISNQNGGYAPLMATYDHAIISQSYMRRVSDRLWLIAPIKPLLAFVIEDKITKRAHGVDGQLVAEMVVQAVFNCQIALNFESSVREEAANLIYPKDIREGKTFYSTAIRVTGYQVSIYRAEIPLQYIDAILNGYEYQPKADKFIIREVASPSGGPFNLLKIDELRSLFDLLASISINCQLPGDRPSIFVKQRLRQNN